MSATDIMNGDVPGERARRIAERFTPALPDVGEQEALLTEFAACGTAAIPRLDAVIEAYYGDTVDNAENARRDAVQFLTFIDDAAPPVRQAVARRLVQRLERQRRLTALGHLATALGRANARGAIVLDPPVDRLCALRARLAALQPHAATAASGARACGNAESPASVAAVTAASEPDRELPTEVGVTIGELDALIRGLAEEAAAHEAIADYTVAADVASATGMLSDLFVAIGEANADRVRAYAAAAATGQEGRARTPLHAAALLGQADSCAVLLAAGAACNATDALGLTPLESAVWRRQVRAERLCASHGETVARFAAVRDRDGFVALCRIFSRNGAAPPRNLSTSDWTALSGASAPDEAPLQARAKEAASASPPARDPAADLPDNATRADPLIREPPSRAVPAWVVRLLIGAAITVLVLPFTPIWRTRQPMDGYWVDPARGVGFEIANRRIADLKDGRASTFKAMSKSTYAFDAFPPFSGMKYDEAAGALSLFRSGRNKRGEAWMTVDTVLTQRVDKATASRIVASHRQ